MKNNSKKRPKTINQKVLKYCGLCMAIAGIVLIVLPILVLYTQNNQVVTQAQISSYTCESEFNPAVHSNEQRCSLDISFTTTAGQTIYSRVVDAFPSEITQASDSTSTIQIRYDKNNPRNVVKESNFMPVSTAIILSVVGVTFLVPGLLLYLGKITQ